MARARRELATDVAGSSLYSLHELAGISVRRDRRLARPQELKFRLYIQVS
jgi:hypothetical protein